MTLLARVIIETGNWPGAPGINVLHFSPGTVGSWDQAAADDLFEEVQTTMSSLDQFMRNACTITIQPDITIFEDTTGEIDNVVVYSGTPSTLTGSGSSSGIPWSSAALIRFTGDKFLNGRRLNGRMYFGPLSISGIDTNGSVLEGLRTGVIDQMAPWVSGTGPRLCVWHRPTTAEPSSGDYADVMNISVRDTFSNLRRRAF